MAPRHGGRDLEVERPLELSPAARLRGERRLPMIAEAPLVVDDAKRPGPPLSVDAVELAADHKAAEGGGRTLLEPDGLPVAERREVEGGEGLDGAHDLRKARADHATQR